MWCSVDLWYHNGLKIPKITNLHPRDHSTFPTALQKGHPYAQGTSGTLAGIIVAVGETPLQEKAADMTCELHLPVKFRPSNPEALNPSKIHEPSSRVGNL